MPSVFPPYRLFLPAVNTAESSVDPFTGSLDARAAAPGTNASASVGGLVTVPPDVVALTIFATITVSFECRAWSGGLSFAQSRVGANIGFRNRAYASVWRYCGLELGRAQALAGTDASGPRTLTVPLRCHLDWGRPIGLGEFVMEVGISASASAGFTGGGWAKISATVPRIDYELFWFA